MNPKPGSIVEFRHRNWVLLPSDHEDIVLLRPLAGTSDDVVAVHQQLSKLLGYTFPSERISLSQFPPLSPDSVADAQSLLLLWQAARLLLREGATPLRSLGRISVRPRTYQLVPLMMALRLNPVRLLIADDVGVGKTVETGLVVRELWERGEVRRLAVLCPPYLCDQWQKELVEKFHLDAVVINPATVGHLDRRTPPGRTVYQHYPVQVISIDFLKYSRNKHAFLLQAPELVVVDEAHGVTPGRGQDRHLRYELVSELARDSRRHLILLTATPHSGIEGAFKKLLGLLHPEFEQWDLTQLDDNKRARLACHFVQRTRKDIESLWEASQCFPQRQPVDETYSLSAPYRRLFDAVYDFCKGIVASGQALAEHKRRMRWWGALALLRCVMSSPRAAKIALERRRKEGAVLVAEEADDPSSVYEPNDRLPNDEVPTPQLDQAEAELKESEKRRLRELERMAEEIPEAEDTKLTGCAQIVRRLLRDDFNPVIWCFYVETAEYVAKKLEHVLSQEVSNLRVLCLTGRTGEEERRRKIDELMEHRGPRVLVATDCLSEGINLQRGFNAVLHYDLPWNPNRLEQREGRVDRYEQQSPVVRAVRYYGKDNPVDAAVIRVLLDKARQIREVLGTHVPVPAEEQFVVEALVHDLFFRQQGRFEQLPLPLAPDQISGLHRTWELDARREKESRTRFAQRALKPEEVRKELEATDQVLGDPNAVRDFVLTACQRLGIQLQQSRKHEDVWHVVTEPASLVGIPEAVRQALPADRRKRWTISFISPTPESADYVGRNHPFVTSLARYLFEQAFSAENSVTARCGAIRTRAVQRLTTLLLLRARFQLLQSDRPPLLAEEVLVAGWELYDGRWLDPQEALTLMTAEPTANLSLAEKQELVAEALEEAKALLIPSNSKDSLHRLLQQRAAELAEAHRRLRRSVRQTVRGLNVEPHWPPDLLGLLVLQPAAGSEA